MNNINWSYIQIRIKFGPELSDWRWSWAKDKNHIDKLKSHDWIDDPLSGFICSVCKEKVRQGYLLKNLLGEDGSYSYLYDNTLLSCDEVIMKKVCE